MDSLKNVGAALSAHYEKVILSVILLALLGAAAYLPIRVTRNSETIRQALSTQIRAARSESQPVDTTGMEQVLRRVRGAEQPELKLAGEHNLFNPVVWKRGGNNRLFKVVEGDEDGPGGLTVTAIRPLEYRIEFDGVRTVGGKLRYDFLVLDETAETSRNAKPKKEAVAQHEVEPNDPFVITEVQGPPENPTGIAVRFPNSTETAVISREKSYSRVAGYEADLVHSNLNARFANVRAKQPRTGQPSVLRLGAESYNIVAITKDEVTVESSTSNKRWTIPLKGTSGM